VAETAGVLSVPPTEANVGFQAEQAVPVYPGPGLLVDREELRARALEALRRPGPDTVHAAVKPASPFTTRQDTERILAAARTALSAPARLVLAGRPLDFPPSRLGRVLKVKYQPQGAGPRAHLVVDPESL